MEAEVATSNAVKEAQLGLDAQVLAQYAKLTEAEIKTLVVDDKWLAAIWAALDGEVQRLTHAFANRVGELEERYAATLSELRVGVDRLSVKVEEHLEKMGTPWA